MLNANNETAALRKIIVAHQEIIPLFSDIPEFKRQIWLYCFDHLEQPFDNYHSRFSQYTQQIRQLYERAEEQSEHWQNVVDQFNRRFRVPFKVKINNKANFLLKDEAPNAGWRECRSYDTVMTIYDILCYQKGDVAPALSGQWCTVGNFIVTGITQADGFARKYAELVDGNLAQVKAACEQMGGEIMPQMAGADLTCRFWATPFFPVLLQFWEGDEDFPPKLMLLWDSNTPSFLHFETTFYLQGDLLERLMHRFKAE